MHGSLKTEIKGFASVGFALVLGLGLCSQTPAATCVAPPSGLVGWWSGDGNAADLAGTNNGSLQGGATATAAAVVGQGFSFDGASGFVQIPDAPALRPTNLTIETWVRFDSLDSTGSGGSPPGDQYIVFKQNTRNGDFEGFDLSKTRVAGGDVFRFLVTSATAQTAEIHSTTLLATGIWYHVAAVRGPNFSQIFVNGLLETQTNVSFAQNYGSLPLFFGTSGQSYWDRKLKGALDEVSLYNRGLSAAEIASLYAAGAAGKCKSGLTITQGPQSQSVAIGGNALFTVAASGSPPLSYQWQFNGAEISGATNTSLPLANVQPSDAGNYQVVVTNTAASLTSAVAVLTVLAPPTITTQPQSLTNLAGTTATFSATAAGTAPLSFQWRFNGANLANSARISGATTSALAISTLIASDAGNYTLVVNNTAGAVTSAIASLTIISPPLITSQPTGRVVAPGALVTFSVTASGTAPLGYQWRKDGSDLSDGGTLSGANTPGLTISGAQIIDAGNYQVVVTNALGGATSAVAILTVLLPPAITAQPQSLTNTAGTTANFSATTTGSSPLGYQWRFNGANLANGARVSGATSPALSISSLQASDAGNYVLVVSNAVGVVTSAVASLTVLSPPLITSQPASQSVAPGALVNFSVSASGTAPLGYQWQKNGANLGNGGNFSGANSSVLTLSSAQTNDAGNYQAVVTNLVGAVTSAVAALTVVVPGNCAPAPNGVIGWWTGDGTAGDLLGNNNGSLQGGASASAAGFVGTAFLFDGTNNFVQIPDAPVLRPTNLTIEAWVRFASLNSAGSGGSPAGDQYIVFKQNTRSGDFEGFDLSKTRVTGGDVFRFLVTSATAQTAEIHSTTLLATGVWYHVAAVRGPSSSQIYVNGKLEGQGNVGFVQNYGTLPLYLGTSGQAYWDHKFKGNLDEVTLYNRALASNEIAAIYAAGSGGKCKTAVSPTIVLQPTNQVLLVGASVTFNVTVYGTTPLNYRWFKDGFLLANGGNVSGATSSALTLSTLQASDAGNFQVVITNSAGSVTSLLASLNTGVPPANDNFASAVTISGSTGSVTGNNANATKQSGEPSHGGNAGGPSVWYNWTAPSASPATFDTALSTFDTLLAVYTGNAVNALTLIAGNNDISSNNIKSRVTFTPVAGTVYHIAVDGANGANGNLTLRWAQASTPLPDLTIVGSAVNPRITTETFASGSCAVMEGLIQAGTRRLIRFDTETENQGTADLFFGNPASNPLFVWAPCHAHYHFQNYMAYRLRDANGRIAAVGLKVGFCILDVFRWDPSSAGSAKYSCSNQGIQTGWGDLYDSTLDGQWIDITGLPDGNYTIEMEPNPQGIIQEANYANNLTQVPISIGNSTSPPLNDNFASSQTLLGGFTSIIGNSTNATKQSGEPNHAGNAGGHSVWYQWTALSTKSVTLDTIGSSFNTLLAVYTGSSVNALSLVASNDDIVAGSNLASRLSFPATASTIYRIAVDGVNAASGPLTLTLNQTLQNDNFSACQFIGGVNGYVVGSDAGATKEAGEPNHAGNAGGSSIWYCWTAPINGSVTFNTLGSTFNTLLAVYTGSALNALTPIASNDDITPGSNLQSSVTFNAVGLTMYHIAVDGYNADPGDSVLSWNLIATGNASPLVGVVADKTGNLVFDPGSVLSYEFLPEGEFQISITGLPQQRYRIERSCDLAHWAPLAATVADFNGHAVFTDKAAPHLQTASGDPICGGGQVVGASSPSGISRFYRAVIIPAN